jgi:hypothetical protein
MGYRKEAAKGLSEGTLWLIGIIVLGMIVGGVIFAINVATSNAKGAGDVVIKNNSAANRIEKQEGFRKLYAKVETNKTLVAQHTKNVALDPTDKTAKQTLLGVQSACVASVEQYNAEVGKVTSKDWLPEDLPESLSNAGCN